MNRLRVISNKTAAIIYFKILSHKILITPFYRSKAKRILTRYIDFQPDILPFIILLSYVKLITYYIKRYFNKDALICFNDIERINIFLLSSSRFTSL